MKKHIIGIALLIILLGTCILFGLAQKNNESSIPPLSDKDIKLIEEFIYEMNLLDGLKLANNAEFNYQYAKFQAAYNNIVSLCSDSVSIFYLRAQAIAIEINYLSSHRLWEYYDKDKDKELDEALNRVSESRELFIKMYTFYKDGVTISESNKFLIDNGLVQKDIPK
ncbi:MAG: hypothetical protein WC364_13880 [Eubacteriales bacterium]|jgi:hypothetical protein